MSLNKLAYIAGSISKDQANYKRRFKAAENYLRALGYDVFNPAELVEFPTWTEEEYISCSKIDIAKLMVSDVVYFLPKIGRSKGSKRELKMCKWYKIPYRFISKKTQAFIEQEYLK